MTWVPLNLLFLGRHLLILWDNSDDLDYLPVLVSLPAAQTVFEYLVGAWKRLNSTRAALFKKVNILKF